MSNVLETRQLSSAGSWTISSREFSTPEDQIISGTGFDINNDLYEKRILSFKQSEELLFQHEHTYHERENGFSPLGQHNRARAIKKNESGYNNFVLSNLATEKEFDFDGPSSSSNLFGYHYNVQYCKMVCSSPTAENTPHSNLDNRKFSICSEDSTVTLTSETSIHECLTFSKHKIPFKKFKTEFSNIEEFGLNDDTYISNKDFDSFWNNRNDENNVSKKRKISTSRRKNRASSIVTLQPPVKFS